MAEAAERFRREMDAMRDELNAPAVVCNQSLLCLLFVSTVALK